MGGCRPLAVLEIDIYGRELKLKHQWSPKSQHVNIQRCECRGYPEHSESFAVFPYTELICDVRLTQLPASSRISLTFRVWQKKRMARMAPISTAC